MSVVNQDGPPEGAASETPGPGPRGRLVRPPSWFGGDDEDGDAPGAAAERGGLFAEVVVNRAFDQALTYRAPRKLVAGVRPGVRVKVPLGKRGGLVTGYCVSVGLLPPEGLEPSKIKAIAEVLDPVPLIDARMLELTRWMAGYYLCSWGQALDAVVPAGVRKQAGTRVGTFLVVPEESRRAWADGTLAPRLTNKQAAAVEVLCRADGELLTVADVCRRAKCGPGVVDGLRKDGVIHTVKRRLSLDEMKKDAGDEPAPAPSAQAAKPKASNEKLYAGMRTAPNPNALPAPSLLFGKPAPKPPVAAAADTTVADAPSPPPAAAAPAPEAVSSGPVAIISRSLRGETTLCTSLITGSPLFPARFTRPRRLRLVGYVPFSGRAGSCSK